MLSPLKTIYGRLPNGCKGTLILCGFQVGNRRKRVAYQIDFPEVGCFERDFKSSAPG
jgi:hypothetical protein